MRRFAGIAAIAFAAHSGLAWAQPATGGPDEGPRSRVERSAPGDQAPGAGERGGPQQRLERPQGAPRGAQIEERRGEEPQRGQIQQRERPDQAPSPRAQQEQQRDQRQQQRDQAQRERPDQAPNPRAQQEQRDQRQQQRDQAQRERQEDRNGRRPTEQAQPDNRAPGSPETAQPQRPDNRPGTPNTAQPAPRQGDQPRPSTNAQRPDATQPGMTSPQPAENRATPGGPSTAGADNANQRIVDTVRQRVERNEVRPVQNLGVSVSVGAELPSRVQLQPLPSDIAAIRPQYRDYRYTVSDREIVIVDPRSRRIVEVIDRGGDRRGSVDIYATFERQRDVRRWHRPDTLVFRQGVVLPAGVPYHELPDEVIERHPDWRGYQYVMTESEEVAIVEPRTRRIVEVVDKNASRSAAAAPAGGSAGANPPPSNGTADRHELARMILADARPGEIQGIDGLRGAILPMQVALRPLPAAVEQQDQQLRGYQYTLIGDDVLIVDPKSREIVDVIE